MRLIDADAIAYESIDSCDTGRHEHYYGTGIIAARKEDIDAMPTIQPEPHWVPCGERLPEKNGEYLCQEKLGFLYVDTWNGEYWECADLAYGTVIAWMPLPESFKEVA